MPPLERQGLSELRLLVEQQELALEYAPGPEPLELLLSEQAQREPQLWEPPERVRLREAELLGRAEAAPRAPYYPVQFCPALSGPVLPEPGVRAPRLRQLVPQGLPVQELAWAQQLRELLVQQAVARGQALPALPGGEPGQRVLEPIQGRSGAWPE